MAKTILIVDDDRAIRDGLTRAISSAGFSVRACEGISSARRALAEAEVDCMLLDIRLKDGDGLDFLTEVRKTHPRLPVVMATAYGDSDRTILAMRQGAFDYVTKPFDLDALLATIARASKSAEATVATPPKEPASDSALVGSSPRMLDIWKAIGRAASSEVPVLVTGESGTGKELVARAIHENSERRDQPFVAVNIAALPATLVESELFGHEKGAFTGANARREGRFEVASRGTLFLDEIGDLELSLQTKLLRVLQDGTFERVGSQSPLTSHARVIAATSREVLPKAKGTTLREDLFYRLGVIRIEVPPLRERTSDIPLLVESFLRRHRQKHPRRAISEGAMRRLTAYPWPGNVRELLHVLERACVMTTAEVIDDADLALAGVAGVGGAGVAGAGVAGAGAGVAGAGGSGHAAASAGSIAGTLGSNNPAGATDRGDESLDMHRAVEALERSLIDRALKRSGGNRAEAARLLGIARPQLYAKMKDLGLELPEPVRRGGSSAP